MHISSRTLLSKMAEKVNEARVETDAAKIRELIQAVKTLCEVILEDPAPHSTGQKTPENVVPMQIQQSSATVETSGPLKEKRLVTDDGANGDSIFDF